MELQQNELEAITMEYFDVDNAENFNNDYKDFMYAYQMIKNYPCVMARDEESLIRCLHLIAWDIASNEYFKSIKEHKGIKYDSYDNNYKPIDYIISDSLYRIYSDDAIISLSDEYRHYKRLILQ